MVRFGFDNSYRRLPERFFAPLAPAAVSAPRLIAFNRPLAPSWGSTSPPSSRRRPRSSPATRWPWTRSRSRWPTRVISSAVRAAARRRAGVAPRRGGRPSTGGGGTCSSRGRADAVLAPRRRASRGRAGAARVCGQRGDARARHSDHAGAGGGGTGEGRPRPAVAGRRAGARGGQPHPGRHVPVLRGAPRRRGGAALADHVIARHDPDIAAGAAATSRCWTRVAARQAALVARWMHVGFIHGVMNTDNMAVSGETIDYGPCAFLEAYDPADGVQLDRSRAGGTLTRTSRQIAQWNLARFAETLLPLIDPDTDAAIAAATEVMDAFPARFAAVARRQCREDRPGEPDRRRSGAGCRRLLDVMHAGAATSP